MAESWGGSLWDQWEAINSYTDDGIEFCSRVRSFIKERSRIEAEFGKEMRKLAKNYTAPVVKRKAGKENNSVSSFVTAFNVMVSETDDIGKQHESLSEALISDCTNNLKSLIKDKTNQRKGLLADGNKLQVGLKNVLHQLDKVKAHSEKASKESEAARLAYERADKDLNTTRQKVDQLSASATQKKNIAETAHNDYLAQLDKYNDFQEQYYFLDMPAVMDQIQAMEEDRIVQCKSLFMHYSQADVQITPIVSQCLSNITNSIDAINPANDSQLFIECQKTGFQPPLRIEPSNQQPASQPSVNLLARKQKGLSGSLFGKKKKEAPKEKNDFSHLPPEKRKKKIHQKINELNAAIEKEKKGISGSEKLLEGMASMADEKALDEIQKQIAESQRNIENMQMELQKFQLYISVLEDGKEGGGNDRRSCYSITDLDEFDVEHDEHGDQTRKSSIASVGGGYPRCVVLYDFQGSNESELNITLDEYLDVIEDPCDGWVRVQRDDEIGYVPESYVQMC